MERFWQKVDRRDDDECWPWLACLSDNGYGQIRVDGRLEYAHRVAYRLEIGPIPDGLQIDHVKERGCTRRDCCNPAHLEAVTQRENLLRGDTIAARNASRTHCPSGHEYTPENTYRPPSGGRRCRVCIETHALERRDRQLMVSAATASPSASASS